MTIRFLRDYQGYSKGSEVTNLSAAQEAAIVAAGAATYGGRVAAYFHTGVNDAVDGLEDDAGNQYGLGVSYTLATLPAASAMSGLMAYVSDVGAGIFVRSNGTRWLPINGRAVIKRSPATEPTTTTAAETDVPSQTLPLPIGLWKDGDLLRISGRVLKSGESDSVALIARINNGLTAVTGTNAGQVSQPATTNNDCQFDFWLKRLSATTLRAFPAGAGFVGTGSTVPATITVADMDANQMYAHLTCTITGGGGETVTFADYTAEWVPCYN